MAASPSSSHQLPPQVKKAKTDAQDISQSSGRYILFLIEQSDDKNLCAEITGNNTKITLNPRPWHKT
ncbi:MAG: hypothetical protein GY696_24560 [Gammaproteobacteria bacterium]|nr:hypothetical protein [Gammaproteobacteria bacterium]